MCLNMFAILGFPIKESCPTLSHLVHYEALARESRNEGAPTFPRTSRLRSHLTTNSILPTLSTSEIHPNSLPADSERLHQLVEQNADYLLDLVEGMLVLDPARRKPAKSALNHTFFSEAWHLPAPDRLFSDIIGE